MGSLESVYYLFLTTKYITSKAVSQVTIGDQYSIILVLPILYFVPFKHVYASVIVSYLNIDLHQMLIEMVVNYFNYDHMSLDKCM